MVTKLLPPHIFWGRPPGSTTIKGARILRNLYRMYSCSHCDRGYATPSNLKRHYLTHNLGPYTIPILIRRKKEATGTDDSPPLTQKVNPSKGKITNSIKIGTTPQPNTTYVEKEQFSRLFITLQWAQDDKLFLSKEQLHKLLQDLQKMNSPKNKSRVVKKSKRDPNTYPPIPS
jgi:Zinc finger, C2H2 type